MEVENLVLPILALLGSSLLAFISRHKAYKKALVSKSQKPIEYPWLEMIVIVLLAFVGVFSIILNSMNTKTNNRQAQERYQQDTATLATNFRNTISTLKNQIELDREHHREMTNQFLSQSIGISSLQHPLKPLVVQYQLKIDFKDSSNTQKLVTILKQLKDSVNYYKYVNLKKEGKRNYLIIHFLTSKELNSKTAAFQAAYSELFYYLPDINILFYKDKKGDKLSTDEADLWLNILDLGAPTGNNNSKLKLKIDLESQELFIIAKIVEPKLMEEEFNDFNSFEGLKNGEVIFTFYKPIEFITRSLIITFYSGHNMDAYTLRLKDFEARQVTLDQQKKEVFYLNGAKFLSKRKSAQHSENFEFK